ncbi:hypothetical protein ABZP36_007390 [Zizania latifolia]
MRWSSVRTAPSSTSSPPPPTRCRSRMRNSRTAWAQRLRMLHTVETADVFDMKWSPVEPLLAQADAHGRLALWRLEQEHGSDKGVVLRDVLFWRHFFSNVLVCGLEPNGLSVGLSDGSLCVISMREDRSEVSEQWSAHQYEVWTCYFDRAKLHLLYRGSNDCSFQLWIG